MNRHVSSISGRLSLRPPQRESLEILAGLTDLLTLGKDHDLQSDLEKVRQAFPSVTDFERDFASVCFALASGVGKTRLMGAFIPWFRRV